jgi:hypothetical protein
VTTAAHPAEAIFGKGIHRLFREANARRVRRWMVVGTVIAVLVIGGFGLWARTSSGIASGTKPAAGTVTGQLLEEAGVLGPPRALAGAVELVSAHGHRTVAIGADGTFTSHIRPGRYTAIGRSPRFDANAPVCAARSPVVVQAKHQTPVTVICDGP